MREAKPGRWVGAAAGIAATATLLVALLPGVRFAYHAPSLHVAVETAEALIGLSTAYLLFGRFQQSSRLCELLLVCALSLFAFTNLFLSVLPSAVAGLPREAFLAWASLCTRLLGATIFAAAPFVTTPWRRRPRLACLAVVAVCGATVLVTLGVVALAPHLPPIIDVALAVEASRWPRLVSHPAVLAAHATTAACYAIAAAGFLVRARRERDELMAFVAVASTLAGFARVNYLLFPSLYSEWVYTGDVLRLGFYLVLLSGSAREIRSYWQGLAESAVQDERRRIARDLHDGLAQELAFIRGRMQQFQQDSANPLLAPVAAAAERALDESRHAITLLTRNDEQSLDDAIAESAEDVARRQGVRLRLDLPVDVKAPPATREAFRRIVREALNNAVRHGNARLVTVHLETRHGLVLRVTDDGSGFDPAVSAQRRDGGFGLVSMRERAEALGGRLHIHSADGRGTQVEVSVGRG